MAFVGIVSTIPVPPISQSALADSTHTSNTKQENPAPTLKTEPVAETTAVEPVEAPPAPEPVPEPAPAPEPVVDTPTYVTPQYSGSHEDWMAAAGISPSDYAAVDYIISMESGWNPNATNASSGAHGLPQALPYSKTGCGWSDPVCQLQWASGYASRYGGWWGAYSFWQQNHWW